MVRTYWLVLLFGVLLGCGRDVLFTSGDGDDDNRIIPSPSLTATSSNLCDDTDPDLIGCYGFANTGADQSMYGHDAAMTDEQYVAAYDGFGLLLTDTTRVVVSDHDRLDGPVLTIEFWVRPDFIPSQRARLVDKEDQFTLELRSGGTVRMSCGSDNALSTRTVNAGEWTHVAAVLGDGSIEVFIDGESVATDGGCSNPGGADTDLHLGGRDGSDRFVGALDRVRIWQRARTFEEICTEAANCS